MDSDAVLISLRDLFAARNGQIMVAVCAALAKATGPAGIELLDTGTSDELEYAFNRLFVGPGTVAAPPYASVYLDPEQRLMSESTRMAAAVYETLGLCSPRAGSLPDDHIALELDAVLAFHALATRGKSAELVLLWNYFLHDHLERWIPPFAARIRQAREVPPAICRVADLLLEWLSSESEVGPLESASTMYRPGGVK